MFVISHDIVVYLFAINKYTNIEVYIYTPYIYTYIDTFLKLDMRIETIEYDCS